MNFNLGKLCKYAGGCPVYQQKIIIPGNPGFLIRNIFCNRGYKGWINCSRYLALEEGETVSSEMTPYEK